MSPRMSSMSFEHEADPASLKVLYIDDNPMDLLTYTAALKRCPSDAIDLRTATDLDRGIALLDEWDADAIVLDLSLRLLGSLKPWQLLSAAWSISVVVLSGSHQEELVLTLVEHGAQDYLVKGEIREGELFRSIRMAMIREDEGAVMAARPA